MFGVLVMGVVAVAVVGTTFGLDLFRSVGSDKFRGIDGGRHLYALGGLGMDGWLEVPAGAFEVEGVPNRMR